MQQKIYAADRRSTHKQIDNSKMFGRIFLFSGRIGIKEYRRTLWIISAVSLIGMLVLPMLFVGLLHWWISVWWCIRIGVGITIAIQVYLFYAAQSKRLNDLGNPRRSLFTRWHRMDLYNDLGVDGPNEHGSPPLVP